MTKTFTFPEAKQVLAKQIKDFATQKEGSSAKSSVKRFELRIEKMDLLTWLTQQMTATKIYGSDQSDNYAIAGISQAEVIAGNGSISFAELFKQMQARLTPQYPYLRYYGGLCFDDKNLEPEWKNFGTYKFLLPRFELATKEGKMLFACNIVVSPSVNYPDILKELENLRYEPAELTFRSLEATAREDIPSYDEWQNNINSVLQAFQQNHCEKVVLARKTQFHFEEPLNPWLILRQLKKVAPYSYHFCFQFNDNEVFLGASPERLYRREGKKIDSQAIAGTRARAATHKEDEKLRHDLLSSEKDQREHQFVVNALQTSFSEICQKAEKDPAVSVLSLENGHHLVTEFRGELKDGVEDWQILKLLFQLEHLLLRRRPRMARFW